MLHRQRRNCARSLNNSALRRTHNRTFQGRAKLREAPTGPRSATRKPVPSGARGTAREAPPGPRSAHATGPSGARKLREERPPVCGATGSGHVIRGDPAQRRPPGSAPPPRCSAPHPAPPRSRGIRTADPSHPPSAAGSRAEPAAEAATTSAAAGRRGDPGRRLAVQRHCSITAARRGDRANGPRQRRREAEDAEHHAIPGRKLGTEADQRPVPDAAGGTRPGRLRVPRACGLGRLGQHLREVAERRVQRLATSSASHRFCGP